MDVFRDAVREQGNSLRLDIWIYHPDYINSDVHDDFWVNHNEAQRRPPARAPELSDVEWTEFAPAPFLTMLHEAKWPADPNWFQTINAEIFPGVARTATPAGGPQAAPFEPASQARASHSGSQWPPTTRRRRRGDIVESLDIAADSEEFPADTPQMEQGPAPSSDIRRHYDRQRDYSRPRRG